MKKEEQTLKEQIIDILGHHDMEDPEVLPTGKCPCADQILSLLKEEKKKWIGEIDKMRKNEHKSAQENKLPPLDLVRMYNQALDDVLKKLKE
jgi:hypothetical protein